jgi:predicted metal-dependent peptidase
MSNKADQLAKASKDLILKDAFYGFFLMMLNKQWSTKVPTAGVSRLGINYQLYLNEDFWQSLTPEQHIGLLKHELLHIAFFHVTDFDHLYDKKMANIAMDLEINQYIDPAFLPPGPMTLDVFPELNLEPKKGTQYYYDKLMQGKINPGTCPNLDKIMEACGEGNGEGDEEGNGDKITVRINGKGDVEVRLPNHDTWKEFDDLDEATKKLIKTQTEHIIKEVAEQVQKSRGHVPGEIAEILERINELNPPKFNWRGYLKRFVGGSIKTFTKMSRHKPNFRFQENPGLKHKNRRHILVAVDTSGSVCTDELKEFLNEIHHIQRTGTEVTIIQCDSAISHIGKFDPKKDFEIHGRGGTSFHPVTDYYDENFRKYNCLIYLTDGEASAPEKCRGPVLWVISSKSQGLNEDLKGLQIQLN